MINFVEIFAQNRQTFYTINQDGFKTTDSLRARYFFIISFSCMASAIFSMLNDNIIIGLITAQSILIGFAFNVMVFISSQDALRADTTRFRENKIKALELNALADEIFYNLSYFVTISLLSVLACLVWLLLKSDSTFSDILIFIFKRYKHSLYISYILTSIGNVIWKILLFSTTFESILTFFRLTQRVTFHFRERRRLQNEI